MTQAAHTGIDKAAVRRAFDRLAADYLAQAQVQSEVCHRMWERMELIKLDPRVVLDVGSGPGVGLDALRRRFPRATVIALDLSWRMLRALPVSSGPAGWLRRRPRPLATPLCADFEQAPVAAGSVDCVVSNLALPWAASLPSVIAELFRVLKPGGLLMLTTLGPHTLREWPGSQAALAPYLPDMHDLGDWLVQGGFQGPVMDQEDITLTYSGPAPLLRDIRSWGAMDLRTQRARGLGGRGARRGLEHKGPIAATLEVVYGHAWKPASPARLPDGRAVIQFEPRARTARLRNP